MLVKLTNCPLLLSNVWYEAPLAGSPVESSTLMR